ncbi:MAG: helix-turn-helix transcriptional regulator [Lachnospiraceae bacterium]|nr:helix-turn-helix transcriptional regulator [Lachnospiraceae bacterium]
MDYSIFIWTVVIYVENRLQGKLEYEDLMRETGFSLAHIRDVFARCTGMPLARYVNSRKMANAAFDLVHTDVPVVELAMKYGFSSHDVFTRAFKRETGMTPQCFRKEKPKMLERVKLCAGVYGMALIRPEECGEMNVRKQSADDFYDQSDEDIFYDSDDREVVFMMSDQKAGREGSMILYDVPKVCYGAYQGYTPFPICMKACANYLGTEISYDDAIVESGAAFRMVWNTKEWDGGNVDVIFTFDDPDKVYRMGMKAIGREFRIIGRTPDTKKEAFVEFIKKEIDAGYPCIALGIIGPPEACVITGYQNDGKTLMGWNCFQDGPEFRTKVKIDVSGYFKTDAWWENECTVAVFGTSALAEKRISFKEVIENAIEVMSPRVVEGFAKGGMGFDAWKAALLKEEDIPKKSQTVLPIMVEQMMCQGDAMDCITDGRQSAARYFKKMAEQTEEYSRELLQIATQFHKVEEIGERMYATLGGAARDEKQIRMLADPETRGMMTDLIEQAKKEDDKALALLKELKKKL